MSLINFPTMDDNAKKFGRQPLINSTPKFEDVGYVRSQGGIVTGDWKKLHEVHIFSPMPKFHKPMPKPLDVHNPVRREDVVTADSLNDAERLGYVTHDAAGVSDE